MAENDTAKPDEPDVTVALTSQVSRNEAIVFTDLDDTIVMMDVDEGSTTSSTRSAPESGACSKPADPPRISAAPWPRSSTSTPTPATAIPWSSCKRPAPCGSSTCSPPGRRRPDPAQPRRRPCPTRKTPAMQDDDRPLSEVMPALLRPGGLQELAEAALRRTLAADPTIRTRGGSWPGSIGGRGTSPRRVTCTGAWAPAAPTGARRPGCTRCWAAAGRRRRRLAASGPRRSCG